MRRFVATCIACALLLSPSVASGVSASDGENSRPIDARACAGSAVANNVISLDDFAEEAYYRTAGGFVLVWKPYYWAAEGTNGTFRIRRHSDDCSYETASASYAADEGTATNGQDFTLPPGKSKPLEDPEHNSGQPAAYYQDVTFPVHADGQSEPVVEKATVSLTAYN